MKIRRANLCVSTNILLMIAMLSLHQTSSEAGYDPTNASLQQFTPPMWYEDAKFGVFFHWGVFNVPSYDKTKYEVAFYGHNMYVTGDTADPTFNYHKTTYGDHKTFGYKNFIPMYTMEKFNPDSLADLCVQAGAKYVAPVAIFHDAIALYKSTVTRWNIADMGPKKDICMELSKAVRARGLKFGVTNHYAECWGYFHHDPNFDTGDPQYADLYTTGEGASNSDFWNYAAPFSPLFLKTWLAFAKEQVDIFQPDILWFDGIIGSRDFDSVRLQIASYYYNKGLAWDKTVVINQKYDALPPGTSVLDLESGLSATLRQRFWQTDVSVTHFWGYTASDGWYKTPSNVAQILIDNVSKNGSLLLACSPRKDGTLDPRAPVVFRAVGAWLKINGEAIYGTRPWNTFGEGPSNSNNVYYGEMSSQDIRFTANKARTAVYAFGMVWPANNLMTITSFKTGSFNAAAIDSMTLIGNAKVTYTQDAAGLKITLPSSAKSTTPYAVKIVLKVAEKDPFAQMEAETYSNKTMWSTASVTCTEGGRCLDSIRTGDWVVYSRVNFGAGADKFQARVSGLTGKPAGSIDVYLDDPNGKPIGTLTGAAAANTYSTLDGNLTTPASGTHDLYLVFKAGYRVNWIKFTPGTVATLVPPKSNPVAATKSRDASKAVNLQGRTVKLEEHAITGQKPGIGAGVYIRKTQSDLKESALKVNLGSPK